MTAVPARVLRLPSLAVAVVMAVVPVAAWLWQPESLAVAVIARSLAFVAALHGFGRIAASVAGDDGAPALLTLVWGLVVYLGLGGVLLALHAFGPGGMTAMIVGGVILGAGWTWHHAPRLLDAVKAGPSPAQALGAVVIAMFAVVAVLAAAGHWQGFSDGETNLLGQLRRLADTGGLDDAVGFPRATGLGGHVVLAAIVDTLDLRTAHVAESAIMFVLALALVVTAVRRVHGSPLALIVLSVLVLAIPVSFDAAPRWSIVVFVLGAAISLDRALVRRSIGNAALVVATVATLLVIRHAAAGFAVVMLLALMHAGRDWPRPLGWRVPVGIVAAIVVPYLIAAARASGPLGGVWSGHGALARAAGCAAAAGGAALLFGLALRRGGPYRAYRTSVLAACAGAALAGVFATSAASAWNLALSFGIAAVLLIAIVDFRDPAEAEHAEPPPSPRSLATVAILATAIAAVLSLSRLSLRAMPTWANRVAAFVDDVRAIDRLPRADRSRLAQLYADAQQLVPHDARLGIRVDRPDLVDYRSQAVVDLSSVADQRAPAIDYLLLTSDAIPMVIRVTDR